MDVDDQPVRGSGGPAIFPRRGEAVSPSRLRPEPMWNGHDAIARVFAALVCCLLAALTWWTAARDGDFWWGDGASFALNGELVRDYLASGFARGPAAFAADWYFHYPALTISLYPPVFPLAEACLFALFGFSHGTALATVTVFSLLAFFGLYRTMRTTSGVLVSVGAVAMLAAAPGVMRWSREVVMEIPALAFLLLAAAAFARYQAERTRRRWVICVLLLAAAAYTKQTAIFVAPGFGLALLIDEGLPALRRRSFWVGVAAGLAALAPLALFTVFHAAENFHIAFGAETGEADYDRWSFRALTAYGRAMPEIAGPVPLVGAAICLVTVWVRGWRSGAERRLTFLMLSWFAADYLAISVTADFEPRYATFLAVPPVVLTALAIGRLPWPRPGGVAAAALGLGLFAVTLHELPVIRVTGYGETAQFLLEQSEPGGVVLFHGTGSKNLSFALRAHSPEPKLYLLRSDKILADYRITPKWGLADRGLSDAEIEALIDRHGVGLIAFQPGFWPDLPSSAALRRVLESDRFALAARFHITSEDPSKSALIRVYRNLRPAGRGGAALEIKVPALDGSIKGRI